MQRFDEFGTCTCQPILSSKNPRPEAEDTALIPKIVSLANLLRLAKNSGQKYVLMLGAGASLSSGVTPTGKIMQEMVDTYGAGIEGRDLSERFNKLWEGLSDQQRNDSLKGYLDHIPSPGYAELAALIRDGYFDQIVTFNYDRLLQKALVAIGLREDEDFKVIVCGDLKEDIVVSTMEMPTPRIKILKVHGSLTSPTKLWSYEEMLVYPDPIQNLMTKLTRQPIYVCGYGFEDLCVARCFSTEGGPIYCINPSGVPSMLRPFLVRRNSESLTIDGPDAYFDKFFTQTNQCLRGPVIPSHACANPFKYLESYDLDSKAVFWGREGDIAELTNRVKQRKKSLIYLLGKPKSGKTSLVRAGLFASLNENEYQPIYIRCRGNLEQTLISSGLKKWVPGETKDLTGVEVLSKLAANAPAMNMHILLVLDQFERIVDDSGTAPASPGETLLKIESPNLTIVCVSTDDRNTLMEVVKLRESVDVMVLPEIQPSDVGQIITKIFTNSDCTVIPEIIQYLVEQYRRGTNRDQSGDQGRPTLAHIQAICYLLFERNLTDLSSLQNLVQDCYSALDLAITKYDIINFIEDVGESEERNLLRNIIRVVSHPECNQKIVNFVREHVAAAR
jgi:hypothetical protein